MLRLFWFSTLILLIVNIEVIKTKKIVTRTNFIKKFNVQELSSFVKQYKHVIVIYNSLKTKKGRGTSKWFEELAEKHDENETFFIQIRRKKRNRFKAPLIRMYVYGFKKEYHGKVNSISVDNWVSNILKAKPEKVSSVEEISDMDSHYFAIIDEKWLMANNTHLGILAKLICPVKIFYGISEDKLTSLTSEGKSSSPLWLYREYNKEVITVDTSLSLIEKADFILNNEFPTIMSLNENSFRLLIDYMVPTVIYFADTEDDDFIDIMKNTIDSYKDYLVLTLVYKSDESKYASFLKSYLDITKTPAIRILNIQDHVKRYKYVGEYKQVFLDHFLQNYVDHNLRHFLINEKLKGEASLHNIKKTNFAALKDLLIDMHNANLIYCYSESLMDYQDDLASLLVVKSVFRNNPNFNIYVLNLDKNDIDGSFYLEQSFLILTAPPKQIWYLKEKINFTSISNFIVSKLPHMVFDNPVLDEDL